MTFKIIKVPVRYVSAPPSNKKIINSVCIWGVKTLGSAYKWYTDLAINANIMVTKTLQMACYLLIVKFSLSGLWSHRL